MTGFPALLIIILKTEKPREGRNQNGGNHGNDRQSVIKEDLEELNEYKEAGDDAGFEKKYGRIMERLEKSLNR